MVKRIKQFKNIKRLNDWLSTIKFTREEVVSACSMYHTHISDDTTISIPKKQLLSLNINFQDGVELSIDEEIIFRSTLYICLNEGFINVYKNSNTILSLSDMYDLLNITESLINSCNPDIYYRIISNAEKFRSNIQNIDLSTFSDDYYRFDITARLMQVTGKLLNEIDSKTGIAAQAYNSICESFNESIAVNSILMISRKCFIRYYANLKVNRRD